MMPLLEVENLTVRYGALTILDSVSFAVEPGEWLMVAGPNGAGKSTLIGAVAQTVPYTGSARFEGEDLARMKPREAARRIGVLSQNNAVAYAFTVEEIVRMGRYAYAGTLSGDPGGDAAVQNALALTGMLPLAKQSVLTLSGGELQRAFLAQLFAQSPRLLMLDEPTNHLDLLYQKQVFSLIKDWIAETGGSVISVVHDLSLAKACGSHALLLAHGKTAANGPAANVFTRENLVSVYSLDVYDYLHGMLAQWEG